MKGVFFFIAIFIVQHSMHSWVVLTSLFNQIALNSNTAIYVLYAHKHTHPYYIYNIQIYNVYVYVYYTYLSSNWNIRLYHLIETVFDSKIHSTGEEKKSIRLKYASKYCVEFWEIQKLPLKTRKFINSATYIDNNCILTNWQKTKERGPYETKQINSK